MLFPSKKESLGKCPRCGGSVVELKKGFVCENRDCGFAIWKESKFFTAKKKEAHGGVCDGAAGKWTGKAFRLLFGKERQDLRCRGGAGR